MTLATLCLLSALIVDGNLPAGNVVVDGVEGNVVHVRQDLSTTDRNGWFYWAFRVKGAAGRTLTFDFRNGYHTSVGPRGYRFPNVNGDKTVICREVATERDLLYAGGVFYEVPADNAGGFAELRPIALADEPVRSVEARLGLVFINGRPRALDSLWRNGTAAAAYWLWEECR